MSRLAVTVALSSLLLASCANPVAKYLSAPPPAQPPAVTPVSESGTAGNQSVPSAADRAVKNGDTVAVDYVGRLKDGTIFDASIRSEAEKSKNFNPARDYSPLLFTVGAGQMIKGFDKGVVGMKVGEKRTLEIPPEEAYGTGGTEEISPKDAFQDVITATVSRDKFDDVIEMRFPTSVFENQGKPVPKVGAVLSDGTVEATVIKVENGEIVMSRENTESPFYGKKLAVGLEAETPQGRFVVRRIDDDSVTVERLHALAGKTLVFDVELKEIK